MIRDRITPEKDLGHSDVLGGIDSAEDSLSDDDAALQRRLFGVEQFENECTGTFAQ